MNDDSRTQAIAFSALRSEVLRFAEQSGSRLNVAVRAPLRVSPPTVSASSAALAFGSRLNRPLRASVVVGSVLAAAMMGGCGQEGVVVLASQAEFERAIQSDRPILVDFYKAGCPTCQAFDHVLDTLAKEYKGRAVFRKFELVKSGFIITAPPLQARYEIDGYPTAILFVRGKEAGRWAQQLELDPYRKALDQALDGASRPAGPATSQASSHAH